MARFISEEQLVNNNAFLYEEKIESQYTRFLERPPVFVTYYAINNIETTVDFGFQNIEAILGENSPIKFNKIEHFPVYGLDKIIANLDDNEEGLNMSYDSELVILPNTIAPNPHDFFIIDHIKETVLFMVTEVNFDTVKSNNFYKIGFTMKAINPNSTGVIEQQVSENFECLYTNIGTQDRCIVRSDEYKAINLLLEKFDELSEKYFMLFYDESINCLLYQDNYCKLYDAYLTNFITRNKIFQNSRDYKTISFDNEDKVRNFSINYEKSIYRTIEKRMKNRLPLRCTFIREHIDDGESVFILRRIRNVMSVQFGNEHKFHSVNCVGETYIQNILLKAIRDNDFSDYRSIDEILGVMPVNLEPDEDDPIIDDDIDIPGPDFDNDMMVDPDKNPGPDFDSGMIVDPDKNPGPDFDSDMNVTQKPMEFPDEDFDNDMMVDPPIEQSPDFDGGMMVDPDKNPGPDFDSGMGVNPDNWPDPDFDSGMNAYTPVIEAAYRIIVKYFNNKDNGLFEDEVKFLSADRVLPTMKCFVTVPIVLFILSDAYKKFMAK